MNAHELLPWYVSKSLDPEETALFEAHLPGCDACAREIALVERLHDQLRGIGPGVLPDHPEPASLLAAVSPQEADAELTPADAEAVRRHLAVCFACLQELEWLRGRAVAGGGAGAVRDAFSPRGRRLLWAGLAAAALVLVASLYIARLASGPGPESGITRLQLVPSTQRSGDTSLAVSAAPGEDHLMLLFEVDLGPEDFPALLTVTAQSGEGIVRPRPIEPDDLFRGAYVTFLCYLRDCPPGRYEAAVQPRDAGRAPTRYQFRIVEAEPAVR